MGTGCSRLQQAQDDPLFLRKVNVKDMLGVAKVGIDTILLTDQLAKGLTTYTCNQRREKMDWAVGCSSPKFSGPCMEESHLRR